MYIQEINEEYTQLIKDVETTSLIVADLKKIKSKHKFDKDNKLYKFIAVLDVLDDTIDLIETMVLRPLKPLNTIENKTALTKNKTDNLTDKLNK